MKPRLSTIVMLGLLAFLFGVVFELSAQEKKVKEIDLGQIKIEAPKELQLLADSVKAAEIKIHMAEIKLEILYYRELLLSIGHARKKYQARLDSLNAQIKRRQ